MNKNIEPNVKSLKTVSEFSRNNILVIPQALDAMKDVKVICSSRNSSIYYKELEEDLVDIEFYTNFPCLVYIETGREVITTCENTSVELEPGSAIFFPQGQSLHSDFVQKTYALKAYLVFFNQDVIESFLSGRRPPSKISGKSPLPYCKIQDSGAIKSFFSSINTN